MIRVCREGYKDDLEKILKEQDTVPLLAQRNKVRRKGGWKGEERERGVEKEEGRGKKRE